MAVKDISRTLNIPLSAYYASSEGGSCAFSSTTGITIKPTAGVMDLALLVNPAGSGKNIYIDEGEWGSTQPAEFHRMRNTTITLNPGAKPQEVINRGGGALMPVGKLYCGRQYTRVNGIVGKTIFVSAQSQYVGVFGGAVILRPGQSLAWTIDSQPCNCALYLAWWELPEVK